MWILYECTNCYLLKAIGLAKKFIEVLQILIPIALIIFGSIDLGKAVISADEDHIKKSQQLFIKRCIAAALVFLVAAFVTFVTGFIGNNEWKACWKSTAPTGACSNGALTPTNGVTNSTQFATTVTSYEQQGFTCAEDQFLKCESTESDCPFPDTDIKKFVLKSTEVTDGKTYKTFRICHKSGSGTGTDPVDPNPPVDDTKEVYNDVENYDKNIATVQALGYTCSGAVSGNSITGPFKNPASASIKYRYILHYVSDMTGTDVDLYTYTSCYK